jgi:hypothetical protein
MLIDRRRRLDRFTHRRGSTASPSHQSHTP